MTNDERVETEIDKWRKILGMEEWFISWDWDDSLGHDEQVHIWLTEQRRRCLR